MEKVVKGLKLEEETFSDRMRAEENGLIVRKKRWVVELGLLLMLLLEPQS